MQLISATQFSLVQSAFSFTIAVMGAATIFAFLGRSQVASAYKTALTLTGLVTAIACYNYFRIFANWNAAYTLLNGQITATGVAFSDSYRYVDWLLTVPLLLIELVLVMRLPRAETISRSVRLGFLAMIMIVLGYPGQISNNPSTEWLWWGLAMIPFVFIVFELFVGLKNSVAAQPVQVRGLVSGARWLTIITWCFYPVVFILPMIGFSGGTAIAAVQVGYTIADIIAKAVFGVLIYMIAAGKSQVELSSPAANNFQPAE